MSVIDVVAVEVVSAERDDRSPPMNDALTSVATVVPAPVLSEVSEVDSILFAVVWASVEVAKFSPVEDTMTLDAFV